jgi:hypothetical protein
MAARRTPRQIVFDGWAEKKTFMPEVMDLIKLWGGAYMHPLEATVRRGQTVTPTNVPWPDLTIWFPEGLPGLHLVELKSHDNPKPRGGQPELFASLELAGQPVHVWEPRHLDDLIPWTLEDWSGLVRPAGRYRGGLYVPRSRILAAQLKEFTQ